MSDFTARIDSQVIECVFTGDGFQQIWRHVYEDDAVGIETVYRPLSEEARQNRAEILRLAAEPE